MARPREASKGAGTLVLINTTSFSAASSAVVNNCFSSTYDNYRLLINLSTTSGAGNAITIQWRSSGSNATGNDYIFSFTGLQSNSTTYNYAGGGNGSTGVAESGLSGVPVFSVVDIYGPFLTQQTNYTAQFQCVTTGTVNRVAQGGGRHGLGNSYDGFSLAVAAGTITGEIKIYGYRK